MKKGTGLLLALLPFVAAAEILVSDGFPVGEGGYATTQKALKEQSITDTSVVGWSWQKWNNGGGSGVLYSFGTDSGLSFPSAMTEHGFTAVGASIGLHGAETGNPRCGERMFSDQLQLTGKVYLRFLMNIDSTCAAIISIPSQEADRFMPTTSFASGLSDKWDTDASAYDYFFKTGRNVLFGVAKNLDGGLELDLCVIDASGARMINTLVPTEEFAIGKTYLCIAEIDIDAGTDGKDLIRAVALPADETFTPGFSWATLGEGETLEAEVWSDAAYPNYFGLSGRYQNNNGYFKVDEFVLATEISDVVYYDATYPTVADCSAKWTDDGVLVSGTVAGSPADVIAVVDDGVGEPSERKLGENVAVGDTASALLTDLLSDHTYAISVVIRNASGSSTADAGAVYTGIPLLAKVADANEDGLVAGSFVVTRADTAHDFVVNYTCGGTAVNGVNYQELSGKVVIPDGASSATIDVLPYLASPHDVATTLTVTLAPGNYPLGDEPPSATMTIENLAPPADKNVWVAPEDGNASVASNWSLGRVPTETDDILLDGNFSTAALTWDGATEGVPNTVASWTQTASYTSRVTMPTTRSGSFTQFIVTGNATLNGGEWWRDGNVKGDGNTAKVWLNVKINGDLSVGEGFTFNGEEAGYPKQKGPSSGGDTGSKGGAHGGLGGGGTYGYGTVYGDYRNPITLGSGQYGSDAAGGGAVILEVGGDFVLDGKVTGDAGNGGTGSGQSGGSVWIRAKTLSGGATGLISANGGSPSNKRAGGGAGRISVQLSDPTWTQETLAENFKGTIRAIGGYDSKSGTYSRVPGASGTVYLETAEDQGKGVMRLVNSSWSGQSPHNAVTLVGDGVKWDVSKVEMANNGRVGVASGGELHVPSFTAITGDATVYSLFAFIGGAVTSDVKHDKFVASGFDLAVYASTDFGDYHLVVPDDRKLSIGADAVFTVRSLKVNGTKLAAGEYVASSLTETYSNVSGEGTIKVLGLADGLMIIVR